MGIGSRLLRIFGRRHQATAGPSWGEVCADCAAAVRAYDRSLATLDGGVVRDRLHALGAQLPPLLAVAERLAAAAEQEADTAQAVHLGERLLGLREALRGMAADCDRVGARLRADPDTADLGEQLSALGAGLAEARRHSWTPIAPASRS